MKSATENFPLFYNRVVPLSVAHHGKAGLDALTGYEFARRTNAVMVLGSEFALAALSYPIAFSAGTPTVPLAVLGLRDRENLFVEGDGRWSEEHYIPAYVRRYPYIFVEEPQTKRLVLCVDEAADRFRPQEPNQPFFIEGRPSPTTQEVLKFAEGFHFQYEDTLAFGRWLDQHGLLEERVARVELPDATFFTLQGFRLISPEKLRALDDAQVLELHRKGWLPLLHYHQQSLNNWVALTRRSGSTRKAAA